MLRKILRKDKVSNGLRSDIAMTIKLLYGENWRSKLKPHKLKAIPFDKAFLRRYDKLIQSYLADTFEVLASEMIGKIQYLVQSRTDAADDNIEPNIEVGNGLIAEIDSYAQNNIEIISTFAVTIREIGKDMLAQNNATFATQLREAFGFTPDFETDPTYSHLDSWVNENVSLIKNIDSITTTRLKTIISENFRNGARAKDMITQIKDTTSFTEYRLRLIARDQTAKLHGQITKRQQTSIGITHYIWRGVADERERPSHFSRNNKQYKWSDGLEPGQDFQCRCTAEPVIDFDEILAGFEENA